MKNIIICEKPSVARTIASYLGDFTRFTDKGIGYMENDDWVITWCFGHLVTLCYPEDYDPSLKEWNLDDLPFLPETYKYRAIQDTIEQFEIIKTIYHRNDIKTLYYCPDPAREGVTIQWYVRMLAGIAPGIEEKMIYIDSITRDEVAKGIRNAKPASDYRNIRDAGVCRGIEDFAFGINFSRALSKQFEPATGGRAPIAVGRVMTCVLGMVVDREREIEAFVPTDFYKINANATIGGNVTLGWKADKTSAIYQKIEPYLYNETGFKTKEIAESFVSGLAPEQIVDSIETKIEKKYAPLLFNLAELQATCSRQFKISPAETLKIIQDLYEKKLLTYPRTDARVLSTAIAEEIDTNIRGLQNYSGDIAKAAGLIMTNNAYVGIENTKYVDDSKISDHYAIIPTGENIGELAGMDDLYVAIYELVAKRFLSIFMPPAQYEKVSLQTHDAARGEKFSVSGSTLIKPGYLYVAGIPDSSGGLPEQVKNLKTGDKFPCTYAVSEGQTQPPKHYTTGSMILAMENAGNLIEEEELREQIKSCGIGTSATRAATLDKLVKNEYLKLSPKTQVLSVAPFGDVVYEAVKQTIPSMLNPKMTANWEKGLSKVADGSLKQEEYMDQLNKFIVYYVDVIKKTEPNNLVREVAKKCPAKKSSHFDASKYAAAYLNVPFEDKDQVKALGARWDNDRKCWYAPKGADLSKFTNWMGDGKVPSQVKKAWLDVPFDDKDEAKSMGARWDKDKKRWYVLSNNPRLKEFAKWKSQKKSA